MGAKILIADDESDIVSMLGSFFESKGFRVLPAFNGAEALKQVEKQPDIILLDINMPGIDGLEVCKRIRDHISCPILFLTARIEDTDTIALLEKLPIVATPIYSAFCIIAAALLFYRNRLKKPLAELRTASEKIANNDLDFSIDYDNNDELGQLCASFEIMRTTLAGNFSKMWRQVEERKALNAAFAHDLRTPLTVLKGYNEMLQASENPQTQETATIMGKHISRMESYVSSMSNLRRMEDAQPEYKLIDLQTVASSLYDSAKIVCAKNGKELILQNDMPVSQLSLDGAFVSQVSNNLISNAVRYARTAVTISFALRDNGLLLSVSDDGKGFDKNGLQKATSPYYTEESNHSEHFGLGLYICKLLCEHHNGYLKIENTASGAKVSAYFKSPAL